MEENCALDVFTILLNAPDRETVNASFVLLQWMKELWILVKFICIINTIGWVNSNNGDDNCTHSPQYTCGIAQLATNMVILL